MTAPLSMEQIRTAMDQARSLAGREDTEAFALEAPALLARLLEALDLYVGHEPTLTDEALYEHERAVRARIAQGVNRAERPKFADGEHPDLVVRTTRAIDVRLIEMGAEAPYWIPETGDPQ